MPIEWSEKLSVGVPLIDEQHKELIRRLDALFKACNEGHGPEAAARTMSFLQTYVLTHFSAEEDLMRRHSYPGEPAHKAEHAKFKETLASIAEDTKKIGTVSVVILNRALLDWLLNHISKVDKALGDFLKTKG